MKLTTQKLRQLIKEELQNLKEDPFATTASTNDPFSGKKTVAGPGFDPSAKQKAAAADPFSGKKTAAAPKGADPLTDKPPVGSNPNDPFAGKTAAAPSGGDDDLLGATNAPVKAIKTLDARMDQVEALLKQLVARLKK